MGRPGTGGGHSVSHSGGGHSVSRSGGGHRVGGSRSSRPMAVHQDQAAAVSEEADRRADITEHRHHHQDTMEHHLHHHTEEVITRGLQDGEADAFQRFFHGLLLFL